MIVKTSNPSMSNLFMHDNLMRGEVHNAMIHSRAEGLRESRDFGSATAVDWTWKSGICKTIVPYKPNPNTPIMCWLPSLLHFLRLIELLPQLKQFLNKVHMLQLRGKVSKSPACSTKHALTVLFRQLPEIFCE